MFFFYHSREPQLLFLLLCIVPRPGKNRDTLHRFHITSNEDYLNSIFKEHIHVLTGEAQVKKYIPEQECFVLPICDVLLAERPQWNTMTRLYLIILPNMLALSSVCIGDESHNRLPEDLPTLFDESHRGQSTNVVRLGDLNHFQVHPGSDFTCAPYFRSLPQSQSRAESLSEGAQHNHPHNTIRSAQFAKVLSITSGLRAHVLQDEPFWKCEA